MTSSAGQVFRDLVARSAPAAGGKPLQILGTINAYSAMLARHSGCKAIYLSGSGVATASHGLPDLGITTLDDVVEDARRITAAVGNSLPLLVDIDTGFGSSAFNIQRTIRDLERVGVAAVHMEDQAGAKRCGHRPNKQVVSIKEMQDRIRAAVDARTDPAFVIMARTDALASEGLERTIERARAYVDAGADMIFAEACSTLDEYRAFVMQVPVPILANITEWGKTPMFTVDELATAGINMVLYPLSAFRAMSKAAMTVYEAILRDGHQQNVLDIMEPRAQLYEHINYHEYEKKLDSLFDKEQSGEDGEVSSNKK